MNFPYVNLNPHAAPVVGFIAGMSVCRALFIWRNIESRAMVMWGAGPAANLAQPRTLSASRAQ